MTDPQRREQVDGYESYFGLNEAPFSLAPDPRFLFASVSHSDALDQVAYALERREPLVVITGEIGTGKTLLCRTVLQQLRRKTFLSVISDPLLDRDDMLKQLLEDFGIISKDRTRLTETTRHELTQALHEFLRSLVPIQAHAVVMIDEAQHLKPEVLEQIRLLSNVDDQRGTLLEIILVGQPGLEALLARPDMQQLQQRVSRRVRLEPLSRAEVRQYIEHRLTLARQNKPQHQLPGATELANEMAEWAGINAGVEFAPDAMQTVSDLSGGLPRVINLLCDRSLEEAYASRLRVIDRPMILAVARAMGISEPAVPVATTASDVKEQARSPKAEPAASPEAEPAVPPKAEPEAPRKAEPDAPFWVATPATPSEPERAGKTALAGDEVAVPLPLSAHAQPAAGPSVKTYLIVAAALAFGAVSIWLGVRAARPREAAPPAATTPSAPIVLNPRPASTPEPAATPSAPPPVNADAPPPAATATPPAAAAPATGGRFEIVVASFRTESRATSVAAEVDALGLPIRRRLSDGWYQLISGPFTSLSDAVGAQQRLQRAGITGTQIVER